MASLFDVLERKLRVRHEPAYPPPAEPATASHTSAQPLAGSPPPTDVWRILQNRLSPSLYRPRRDPAVEVHRVQDRRKDPYVVLKHPRFYSYVRLAAEEEYLWSQMDGTRTIKDLIMAYFTRFGSLAMGRVAGLVAHLHQIYLLADKPLDIFGRLRARLSIRRATRWMNVVLGVFFGRLFLIRGVDPWVERFHRRGGWLLYTPPFQVLYVLLCVVGGVLFVQQVRSGQFNILQSGGSYIRGMGLMFLLNYIALLIHEAAHALTCRHYGGKVNGAGFLLYLGMPAFFIDTTDIWTKPVRARIATSWAGPYSGFILAGLSSLLIAIFPGMPLAANLHRLAFVWVIILFFNLIPFVELDGYYILVDWLDIPRLRPRALGFVRRDLWRKLRSRILLTPTERLFAWYGVVSVLVTGFLILMGISFWQARLAAVFRELWAAGLGGRLLVIPIAFVLFVPLLSSLAASLYRGARSGARWLRLWWARPRPSTIREHLALLNRVAFLAPLPDDVRAEVARRLRRLRVRPGQEVFHQGQSGDAFYIIRRGEAEVVQRKDGTEAVLRVLDPGDHFGEIALLGQTTRTAAVRALTGLDLLWLRKSDFERLLAPHVAASQAVDQAIRDSEDLSRLPLLASLPPQELSALAARLRRERFPAQAVVVREGEVGDTFYIIQSGQAEAVTGGDGEERRLTLMGPGDSFGEIALLMDVLRTATVRALTPLVTLSLDRADFEALLQNVLPAISAQAQDRWGAEPTGPGEAALEG